MGETSFAARHDKIRAFLQDVLCQERIELAHYRPGRTPIDFHEDRMDASEAPVFEPSGFVDSSAGAEFYHEASLVDRLFTPKEFNLLILVGGLGAGKSTTVRYVIKAIEQSRKTKSSNVACSACDGFCERRPIRVDCIDLRPRELPGDTLFAVLNRMRDEILKVLVREWLGAIPLPALDVQRLDPEYNMLRTLLLVAEILPSSRPRYPLRLDGLIPSGPTRSAIGSLFRGKPLPR